MTAPRPSPPSYERCATIEIDRLDRAALLDLYRIQLAAVERLERLLGLPASRATREERRAQERK